tara:strand:- start:345 stop:1469 length:1125 start_codon:yes stop_codon:yes gene_type:complete
MKNKKTKIVMISMFKNESKTIGRMLESCYKYIDYWVLQNNGSTDGTEKVVEEFFKDKDVPGFVYEVEEGWISFGWNRNHLLQKCLNTDHGCDWILKMDCDETLEVDDDFDWSLLDDTNIQSFQITAISGDCIYYRCWMWNAKLPWYFKDDVAHECIALPDVDEDFERIHLPNKIRHIGTNEGESYLLKSKYLSDALKLEEKIIREENLFEDLYHFWYIGKSYYDCFYQPDFYPLGKNHQDEFARRSLFYFKEYMSHVHNYEQLDKKSNLINEMAYYTMYLIAQIYLYFKDYVNCIKFNTEAEIFCSVRNEHIVGLAECYWELGQFKIMKEHTERLVDPSRTLPFPTFYFLINPTCYIDSGDYGKYLHEVACQNS